MFLTQQDGVILNMGGMKIRRILPNKRIADEPKLKAFAGDKNLNEKIKFVSERVENCVRKVENAGYEHFLLFIFQLTE